MTYQFSVVVPIFDAAEYLPATLASFAWQRYPAARVQVILVDDGSTDASGAIADAWARGRPNVSVIHQENGGAGAARNRALEVAEGEWFASVDSDDVLDRDYFRELDAFLRRDTEHRAAAMAVRLYVLNEATGQFSDTHALGPKFRRGARLARLADEPDAFALSSTTFLRTDVLRRHGLRYNPDIKPTFEDAELIGRYLAEFDDPVMGLVSRARYYYRRRSAASNSLVRSSFSTPERYTVTPRLGYLGLLRSVADRRGRAPEWAQDMVLYDLMWLMLEEQSMTSKTAWMPPELQAEFRGILDDIMGFVDAEAIEAFNVPRLAWAARQALIVRFKEPAGTPRAYELAKDGTLARALVLARGGVPGLRASVRAEPVPVTVTGQRTHRYFGEEYMTEYTVAWETGTAEDEPTNLWSGEAPLALREIHRVRRHEPPEAVYPWAPTPADRLIRGRRRDRDPISRARNARRRVEIAALVTGSPVRDEAVALAHRVGRRGWSRVERVRHRVWVRVLKERARRSGARYGGAWIVMDRPHLADDNGEHLYRYLRAARPDINAYFFLRRDSPHWDRLAREGFRLVEYGSDRAALITLNAVARISSDAVKEVMEPIRSRDFGPLPGVFVFLQHGVILDDLSRWLNYKPIDLMTTSTRPEYDSIVGPGSPYTLTADTVGLLGLARWDSLQRLRAAHAGQRTVLVMPTWRLGLRNELAACEPGEAVRAAFEESEYGRAWLGLLRSPELARVVGSGAAELVHLVLPPQLAELVPELDLPSFVRRIEPAELNYQRELSKAAVLITDYSSLMFDAALIGMPVIYYQFDRDEFYAGAHSRRAGYFDFGRDGFGPVATDAAELAGALGRVEAAGFAVEEPYASRAEATFTLRDTDNCARTVAAIEELVKRRG